MDFMADQLYSGRSIRILTIVDNYSRESLALRAGFRLTGQDVAEALNQVIRQRGLPTTIRVDDGTEFTSKAMGQWAYHQGQGLARRWPFSAAVSPVSLALCRESRPGSRMRVILSPTEGAYSSSGRSASTLSSLSRPPRG